MALRAETPLGVSETNQQRMMIMQDLTTMSTRELSLLVFNTEYLFDLINYNDELLKAIIKEYEFRDDQLHELMADIIDYKKEGSV